MPAVGMVRAMRVSVMFVVPRLMRSAHTRQMLFHGTLIVGFGRALDGFTLLTEHC